MRAELTLFSLLVLSPRAFGLDGVKILALSQDKKSMILSVGVSEGIEEDGHGNLYMGDTLVASARAVRANNTSSTWMVDQVNEEEAPKEGETYRLELLGDLPDEIEGPAALEGQSLEIGGGPPTFEDESVEEIDLVTSREEEREGLSYLLDTGRGEELRNFYVTPSWAQKIGQMNQGELREYLITSGLANERESVERALHELHGHEIFLRYTSSFESTAGGAYRKIYSSFSLGHEYPLGRTARSLRAFSVEVHYQKGTGPIDTGTLSARVNYLSLGGGLNFYFLNKPYSIGKYMGFIGLGFERGSGQISTPSSQRPKEHDLTATVVNAGIKYRFKGGAEKENTSWSWGPSLIVGTRKTDYALGEGQTISENNISFGTSLYF